MEIQDMDYKEARAELTRRIETLGLSVETAFVPFSQSRNRGEKMANLNWRVTLKRKGRHILTCDYSAGQAHCPAYASKKTSNKFVKARAIALECETGKRAVWPILQNEAQEGREPILPDSVDIISSLCMDSDVLNHATYESWASDFGYDPDSRKGEEIYRGCLAHGLALRAAIGDKDLCELQELAHML